MAFQLLGQTQGKSSQGALGKFYNLGERSLLFLDEHYQALLNWSLRHRSVVLVSVFGLLALAILTLYPKIGREFMPKADEGAITIYARMEEGARIEEMDGTSVAFEALVRREVPETDNVFSHFGQFGFRARGKNQGHIHIWLGPRRTRERSDEDIARLLRREARSVAGVNTRVRTRSGLYIFRRLGLADDDNLEVIVRGHDLAAAHGLAREIKAGMEGMDSIAGIRINPRGRGQPEMGLHIDRERAATVSGEMNLMLWCAWPKRTGAPLRGFQIW
jgi:HAE1 family hydrophobic/amphiphilic exporter-1